MCISALREASASALESLRELPTTLRDAPGELWTKIRTARMEQSRDDVRRLTFWRGVVAEFIGSLFYVFLGCGASMNISTGDQAPVVQGALAFGMGYAGIAHGIRNVSGGHVNPSVSFAALVTRKISVARALLYITAQFLGSILGAAILLGVTPRGYVGELGCTLLADNMSPEQGFGVELFSTFFLVFAWFASFDTSRGKEGLTWAPFGVGMVIVAEMMFAIPYTGGSLNTARSFGTAMVRGLWADHWVYWFGPIVGGILGGVCYDVMFSGHASFKRMNKCLWMVNECDHPSQDGDQDENTPAAPPQPPAKLEMQPLNTRQAGRLSNHSNPSYHDHPASSYYTANHNDIRRMARTMARSVSQNGSASSASTSSMEEIGLHSGNSAQTSTMPSPPTRITTPDFTIRPKIVEIPEVPFPPNTNPIPQGMGLLPCMIDLKEECVEGPDSPPLLPPPRTHRRQTPVVSEV